MKKQFFALSTAAALLLATPSLSAGAEYDPLEIEIGEGVLTELVVDGQPCKVELYRPADLSSMSAMAVKADDYYSDDADDDAPRQRPALELIGSVPPNAGEYGYPNQFLITHNLGQVVHVRVFTRTEGAVPIYEGNIRLVGEQKHQIGHGITLTSASYN
jgi:hypothetical protein